MDDETKRSYEWKASLGEKARAAAELVASEIVALRGVRLSSDAREILSHKLALLWLDGMQHGQTIAFEAAKDLLERRVVEVAPPP
jgi:hypothetical protein